MIEFDPDFATFVCNSTPAVVLAELARAYYGNELGQILPPDEVNLRRALEGYRSGDKLT